MSRIWKSASAEGFPIGPIQEVAKEILENLVKFNLVGNSN